MMMRKLLNFCGMLTIGVGALAGCHAAVVAEPAYVEAHYTPVHVDIYPRYYYEGRPVYLVEGRWYFRDGPSWYVYREEPKVLHERRVYLQAHPLHARPAPRYRQRTYVERAPRAPDHGHHSRSYVAPQAPSSERHTYREEVPNTGKRRHGRDTRRGHDDDDSDGDNRRHRRDRDHDHDRDWND